MDDALLCLRNLRDFVLPGHVGFATFFEGESARNPPRSDSQLGFFYSRAEMERCGTQTGWQPTYLGDWKHPRRQMMMRYVAR